MDHRVIAISREYGSGGREIGEKVARKLSVSFYDKVLLQLAAERSGLTPEFMERSEERASSSFLFSLATATHAASSFFYQYNAPASDQAFFAQASVIRDIADREDCVIIGRSADHILREYPRCVKVFLYAPLEKRIQRAVEEYDVPQKEAADRIAKVDKGRANYYRHYSGETWGDTRTHDLCINTAMSGIDGAVDLICKMAEGI